MGKYCEVCNKGLMNGNRVSHAENKTGRMYAPNVQRVRVLVDGRPTHLNVCTRCLRSGKVVRALPSVSASAASSAASAGDAPSAACDRANCRLSRQVYSRSSAALLCSIISAL